MDAGKELDALNRFKRTKAHFVDCLIAATAVAEDLPVASFDHDFRKFGDVRLETRWVPISPKKLEGMQRRLLHPCRPAFRATGWGI